MSQRTVAVLGCVFLAGVVAGSVLLTPLNKLPGRGAAPLPIKTLPEDRPVLHLELARSEQDLDAIINVGDRTRNIQDARAGNRIDTWLFIPSYAGLLVTIGLGLRGSASGRWRVLILAALVLAVVAAGADRLENAGIDRALDHVQSGNAFQTGDASAIRVPSLVKWLLLVVVLLVDGVAAVAEQPWWRRLFGVLLLLAGGALANQLAPYLLERFG